MNGRMSTGKWGYHDFGYRGNHEIMLTFKEKLNNFTKKQWESGYNSYTYVAKNFAELTLVDKILSKNDFAKKRSIDKRRLKIIVGSEEVQKFFTRGETLASNLNIV